MTDTGDTHRAEDENPADLGRIVRAVIVDPVPPGKFDSPSLDGSARLDDGAVVPVLCHLEFSEPLPAGTRVKLLRLKEGWHPIAYLEAP